MVAAAAALLVAGCQNDCERSSSCFPLGTYVDPNDALGAVSTEICFDNDCHTVLANNGPEDLFSGFNSDYWQEDRKFALRLTVFDSAGKVIDSITETRTMESSRCSCGVLYYDWNDGRLHRLN